MPNEPATQQVLHDERLVTQGSKYSDADRRYACLVMAIEGTLSATSLKTNIPESTIRDWTKTEWWVTVVEEVRSENNVILDAMHTKTIELAAKNVHDRLEKGDAYVDKKGKIKRKPMSGKDSMMVGAIAQDKRSLMRGDPTSRTENVSTDKLLDKLTKRFEAIAKQAEGKTIEGEVVSRGTD